MDILCPMIIALYAGCYADFRTEIPFKKRFFELMLIASGSFTGLISIFLFRYFRNLYVNVDTCADIANYMALLFICIIAYWCIKPLYYKLLKW